MLWGSLAGVALLLRLSWRPAARASGLTLCYMFSLATIHFAGAWISILPASPSDNRALVALGFRECFAGVIAFTAGALLVDKIVARRTPFPSRTRCSPGHESPPRQPSSAASDRQARWPFAYVLLGFLCILLLPVVGRIPSIGAVAYCGAYLTIVGFCLACFQAWQAGRRAQFVAWVGATCTFPVFTILTVGFIGYGAVAAMMVLSFALVHYRPRWQASLGLLLLGYLALSAYVTYMRDRDELRDVVWGGDSYSARATKLKEIFTRFEFFQPGNERQLQAIDGRLNQNYLVGAACTQLDLGIVTFARGWTVWQAVLALVPRIVWPDKPVVAGGGNIVSDYTGITFADDTSVGLGQVMEFYINFGRSGVIIGFFCFGLIVRLLDSQAAKCLDAGDPASFAMWYLPGLSFMQTGGSLVEVSGTFAASVVMVYVVNKLGLPFILGRRARPTQGRRAPATAPALD